MIVRTTFDVEIGHSITVQWYRNGITLVDGTFGGTIVSGASITFVAAVESNTAELSVINPSPSFDGEYTARVTDNTTVCHEDTAGIVYVVPMCRLEITVQPINVETDTGSDVEYTFSYSGDIGAVTIQWFKDDVPVTDGPTGSGSTISGSTTTNLLIETSQPSDAGGYYAIVNDDAFPGCSEQTNTATLQVGAECTLEITAQPVGGDFSIGDSIEMSVAYAGAVGVVAFQWFLDGNPLSDGALGDATVSGSTTDTLEITNSQEAQTGSFTVQLTDGGVPDCVVQSTVAEVTVTPPSPPPGMFIWYKADEQPYTDGQLAIPVFDASGNHIDLIYNGSSPGHQDPHLKTNILNGLAVLNFNETNTIDTRAFPTPITFTGYSIALVSYRPSNFSGASEMSCIILGGGTSSTGTQGRIFSIENAGALQQHYRGYGYSTTCEVLVDYGTWQILTLTFDYAEGIPRLRSNDLTATGAAGPGSVIFNLCSISGAPGDRIAEVLCYNYKLTDADLDELRQYLSVKWGIPITV